MMASSFNLKLYLCESKQKFLKYFYKMQDLFIDIKRKIGHNIIDRFYF